MGNNVLKISHRIYEIFLRQFLLDTFPFISSLVQAMELGNFVFYSNSQLHRICNIETPSEYLESYFS